MSDDDKGIVEHLAKELGERREEFFQTFFHKGAEFATELLSELQIMKAKVEKLTDENAALRHQLASDDAIRDLLTKIEALEGEKKALRNRIEKSAGQKSDYEGRYAEMEKELNNLAALYVASYQLHSTLDPREVLGMIEQLLAQLVGASSFSIYIRRGEDGNSTLEPVYAYSCDRDLGGQVSWGDGPIGEAAETQVNYVADPETREPDGPLACIPMVLGQQTIGVIVIYGLFEQKIEFVDVDFEFFRLLALHAASAIVGAGLLTRAGSIGAGLDVYERL